MVDIAHILKTCGFPMSEIAKRTGMSQSLLYTYRCGKIKNPRYNRVSKIMGAIHELTVEAKGWEDGAPPDAKRPNLSRADYVMIASILRYAASRLVDKRSADADIQYYFRELELAIPFLLEKLEKEIEGFLLEKLEKELKGTSSP